MKEHKEKTGRSFKTLSVGLLLVLVMSIGLLAGCSTEGKAYMDRVQEMNALEQYQFDGTMSMSIDLDSLLKDQTLTAEDKEALELVKNMSFTYDGAYDGKNAAYEMNMKVKLGNKKEVPLRLYMKNFNVMINAEDLVNYMEVLGVSDKELTATKTVLKDVTWIDLSDSEQLPASLNALTNVDLVELNQAFYQAYAYLNENSFKDYQPAVFAKKGGGYEMTIQSDQMSALAMEFINYTISHNKAITTDLQALASQIDDHYFTALGTTKGEVIDALNSLAAELPQFTKEEKQELKQIFDDLTAMIKGTEMKSYVVKTGEKQYQETMSMNFLFNNPDDATENINLKLSMEMNVDGSKNVTINQPLAGVKNIADLAEGVESKGTDITIYLNNSTIYWFKYYDAAILTQSGSGKYELKEVQGYNYLPLRQTAELFGEEVGWDSAKQQPYVVRDGKNTYMTGVEENGVSYVKLRDFEKLGYTVDYDEALNMATINNLKAAK